MEPKGSLYSQHPTNGPYHEPDTLVKNTDYEAVS